MTRPSIYSTATICSTTSASDLLEWFDSLTHEELCSMLDVWTSSLMINHLICLNGSLAGLETVTVSPSDKPEAAAVEPMSCEKTVPNLKAGRMK